MTVPYRVVVAGGGPAALEAVLTLHALTPETGVTLVAPNEELVYRPLSVVEPFARAGVRRYALEELTALGTTVVRDRLARVDADAQVLHTDGGDEIPYDALLIATGVRQRAVVEDAITFTGPDAVEQMHGIVQDIEEGYVSSVAFYAPPGASWTLPLYELALQTGERAFEMGMSPQLRVVTSEPQPLDAFGLAPSDFTRTLLDEAGVSFETSDTPPDAQRVVALGVPEPPAIPGLPAGFLPVDDFCAVRGQKAIWAAGDVTDGELKQGGLATQQASVAAEAIAAIAAGREPIETYLPVLRAVLIAGRRMRFFRRRLDGLDPGVASHRALWWPPSKIAGKRLAPFLDGLDAQHDVVALERRMAERRGRIRAVVSHSTRRALT